MANRYFNSQFIYSFEQQPVKLWLKATIGASGAVTLDAANSKGIATIVKEATAGQYTITLQDKYKKLMHVDQSQLLAGGPSAAPDMNLLSESVASAKTLVIQFSAASVAANMDSGVVLRICIDLGNK